MRRALILGGPGAGKTERLLGVMDGAIARGVPPSEVALVSFTNAAVDEARGRASERFALSGDDLPYFRTTHSLAFRELGLSPSDVVDESHLAEVGEVTGELFTGDADPGSPAAGRNADPLLTVDHYARMTRTSLRAAWEDHGGGIDWHRLKRFSSAYRAYKEDRDLVDFTDMLERYALAGLPPVRARVAIVDEYQDLTPLQLAVLERAFAGVEELWVAGDDDQSIHKWAGAAEDRLLSLDYPRETLPESHRVPRSVFRLAASIVARVSRRFDKPTRAADRDGAVEWAARPEEVDLSSGKWLLLARTRAMLPELAAIAREQGATYAVKGVPAVDHEHVAAIRAHERLRAGGSVDADAAARVLRAAGAPARELAEDREHTAAELGYDASRVWHDALARIPLDDREYYLACLRRGEKLAGPPRVRVETIHGAKGAEAPNVLLRTDMTFRTQRGYELDPDSEARVWYVGATRASERLVLTPPAGPYGYPL